MTLTHTGQVGDADMYELVLDDGSKHKFVVTNVERKVDGGRGAEAIRRAIARIKRKAAANG